MTSVTGTQLDRSCFTIRPNSSRLRPTIRYIPKPIRSKYSVQQKHAIFRYVISYQISSLSVTMGAGRRFKKIGGGGTLWPALSAAWLCPRNTLYCPTCIYLISQLNKMN